MNRIKKNILKVFLSISIIIFVIALIGKNVYATRYNGVNQLKQGNAKLGDIINLQGSTSSGRDDIFCFEHKGGFEGGDYKISDIIDIEGKKATSVATNKTVTKKQNVVMGYILSKGNYSKHMYHQENDVYMSGRNIAIWAYQYTWMSSLGLNFFNKNWSNSNGWKHNYNRLGIDGYFDSQLNEEKNNASKLIEEANEYANNYKGTASAKITGKTDVGEVSNGVYGPFKVKFSGEKLSLIAIDNSDKNVTSSIKIYSDKTCKNQINVSKIKSNSDFYIKGNNLKKLTVSVSSEVLSVKMYLLNKNNFWQGFGQNMLIVDSKSAPVSKSVSFNIKNTGELTISKTDKDTGNKLAAGFAIQTSAGKWVSGSNGSYNYDNNSVNNNTTYIATNGSVTLKDLKFGTYKIYEVKAPEGYNLADQEGYDKNNNWVYLGEATINAKTTKVSKAFKNVKKVSIKGYVWIDAQRTKANDMNSLWDNDEIRVPDVTVNLVNKPNKIIATTKTDANGEYVFDKLLTTGQLKDYYVEFNYKGVKVSNQDISQYIPVAFNSENINDIQLNGSRAIMDEVATKDADLSGKATTYTGTDKENIYGLGAGSNLFTKLISEDGTVLNNINLGIKKIPDPQFEVREELSYVKIGIKGYEYKYIYNNTVGDTTKVAAPRVKWQNKEAYTRDIYPSDISYKDEDSTQELKVSVVYDIYVTNTTTTEIEELYKEKDLKLTKVVNTFDSNRYELDDANWTKDADGKATMNNDYINKQCGNGIGIQKSAKFNIQFNVKRDELLRILQNPKGIVEKDPTQVDATGYHDYTRMDYSWNNSIKKSQNHITKEYTEHAEAPYLIFKLGEERILSGNVFEDTKDSSRTGEVVGNGKYDNGEKNVDDVKVELLDIDKNGKMVTSHIYPATYTENKSSVNVITQPAIVLSDNGKYTIRGIVPGKYYLRFTYGNGTCKIIDPTTNQEVDKNFTSKIENQNINIKDYKSTIVSKDVRDKVNNNGEEWYKKLNETTKYSVALDNLETRKKVNYPEENQLVENIDALTPKFSITIENTPSNEFTVTEEGEKVLQTSNKFESMNFGIIKQPEQRAEIEKLITNVKLTNAQNNLVFNGNPETATMVGVTDLDGVTNGGSSYVRVELAEESIYGSNIEVTYQVKITNTSDLNYYNNDYYNYGVADTSKEVMFQPTEVIDYLDNTLTYVAEKSDSARIKDLGTRDITISDNEVKANAFELTGWKPLYTINSKGKSETDTSDKVILVAQRVLSNQDDDMEIISKAELTKGQNVPSQSSDSEYIGFRAVRPATDVHAESSARLTITPPTGEDRQEIILYAIAGTIALAILGAGIVMIKKIVTK